MRRPGEGFQAAYGEPALLAVGPALRLIVLTPAILWLAAIFVYPLVYTLYLSLKPTPPSNYIPVAEAFSDSNVQRSATRTVLFTATAVPLQLSIGTSLGLAACIVRRGRVMAAMALSLPVLMPPVAVALLWRLLLDPLRGPIPAMIFQLFGIRLSPFDSAGGALSSLLLVDTWQWSAFVALVVWAGAALVAPSELSQAKLDGLGPGATLRWLYWPAISRSVFLLLLLRVVDSLRTFDSVYVLTQGGPGSATELLSFLAFQRAFAFLDYPGASAIAALLLVLSSFLLAILLAARAKGHA